MSETTPPEPWPKKPAKRIRLGDAVAVIAQPVAKLLDAVLGTDIQNCESCADRQKKWNGG